MQSAFEAVIQDESKYQNVVLNVNVVPIKIKCELCGSEDVVNNYIFKCANGHPSRNIIQGEELLIERVHFSDE